MLLVHVHDHLMLTSKSGSRYNHCMLTITCLQFSIPRIPFKTGRSHMTAFVSLDGVYTDFGLRPANIHSFVGLPAFDYDISDLERALFKDPRKNASKALVTLTCPSAKDPLYQDRSKPWK